MKHIILFCLIACWPRITASQSFVNPDTIQQAGDIYIQNTDVYYCPFAPPNSTDTREALSNISTQLLDPNGVGNSAYEPMVHGSIPLANWCPCYDTMRGGTYPYRTALGPYVEWQRLFQARNKPGGAPSNIIVGDSVTGSTAYGPVYVSPNEDVDFRATGTIKMKSGFHVKPGAFFHAYIEPKWGDSVFSDEFSDTAKFHNQWSVANGNNNGYNAQPECSFDSDVYIDTDYQAHDGYALDIALREAAGDTCTCDSLGFTYMDTCNGTIVDSLGIPITKKNLFSTAILLSCPYPFSQTISPLGFATYANAPYGKYEYRDKIPHVLHHTNNWGGDGDLEFDLNETPWHTQMDIMMPNWGHNFRHGPAHGFFKRVWDIHNIPHPDSVTCFISPDAGWSSHNQPAAIFIYNFNYGVNGSSHFGYDTVVAAEFNTGLQGGFPPSLVNSGDTFNIYYERSGGNSADNVTWTVDSTGRIFTAPYDLAGDLFTIGYQPTQITLTTQNFPIPITTTFRCLWSGSLNTPVNYGKLYLIDSMPPSDLHSNTEHYSYSVQENAGYNVAPVVVGEDTIGDSTHLAAYAHEPYRYHTFGMEMLPHEVRILYDSVVVRRIPDRLIPPGNTYYDWAGTYARNEVFLHPAEMDMDMQNHPFGDSVGLEGYDERKYFEQYDTSCSGCWPVTIGGRTYPAAHHLVDYVKIWDMPADTKIQPYITH